MIVWRKTPNQQCTKKRKTIGHAVAVRAATACKDPVEMERGSPVSSEDSDAADVKEEAKINQVKNLLQRNKIQ
jgi:hypothetical protein